MFARFDSMLNAAYETLMKSAASGTDDGWTRYGMVSNIEIFQKRVGNINYTRGHGTVRASAECVAGVVSNISRRRDWDELFDCGVNLEIDPASHAAVKHLKFKPQWPTSARDLVIAENVRFFEDGRIVVYGTSIKHDQTPPDPSGKYVRGNLLYAGWVIDPCDTNDTRSSKVIFSVAMDPCGNIPQMIINAVSVKQPLCVAAVDKAITRHSDLLKFQLCRIDSQPQLEIVETVKAVSSISTANNIDNGPISATFMEPSIMNNQQSSKIHDVFKNELKSAYESVFSEGCSGTTNGWAFVLEKKGVQIFQKQVGFINYVRGEGIIPSSRFAIASVVTDMALGTKCDHVLDNGTDLTFTFDSSNSGPPWVRHMKYKKIWPTTPRDLLFAQSVSLTPSGNGIIVYATSVSHDSVPVCRDFVRGKLQFAGYVLLPNPSPTDPSGDNSTRVKYVVALDPAGSLPQFVINLISVEQPLCVANVCRIFQTDPGMGDRRFSSFVPIIDDVKEISNGNDAAVANNNGNDPEVTRFSNLLDKARKLYFECVNAKESDGYVNEGVKNGIKVFKRPGSKTTTVRGEGFVAASVTSVIAVLRDMTMKTEYDSNFDTFSLIKRFEVNQSELAVTHQMFKPIWPTTARDLSCLSSLEIDPKDPNGMCIIATSVEHSAVPVSKDYVRANLIFGGWRVVPNRTSDDPGGKTSSLVTYIACLDPNGNIPQFVVNAVTSSQPQCIASLNALFSRRPRLKGLSYSIIGSSNNCSSNNDDTVNFFPSNFNMINDLSLWLYITDALQPTSKLSYGWLFVEVVEASNVPGLDFGGTSDPFCLVSVDGVMNRTKNIEKSVNPKWAESYLYDVTTSSPMLHIAMFDSNKFSPSELICSVDIPVLSLTDGQPIDSFFPMKCSLSIKKPPPCIRLKLQLRHCTSGHFASFMKSSPNVKVVDGLNEFSIRDFIKNLLRLAQHFWNVFPVFTFFSNVASWQWPSLSISFIIILFYACIYAESVPFVVCLTILFILVRNYACRMFATVPEALQTSTDLSVDKIHYVNSIVDKLIEKGFPTKLRSLYRIHYTVEEFCDYLDSITHVFQWKVKSHSLGLMWLCVILTVLFMIYPASSILLGFGTVLLTIRSPPGRILSRLLMAPYLYCTRDTPSSIEALCCDNINHKHCT